MQIYGIKNCNTVKKALNFLNEQQIAYTFIDFKKQPPAAEQIRTFLQAVPAQQLINRRGTTYRRLDDNNRQKLDKAIEAEDVDNIIPYLIQHSSLIKRPVAVTANSTTIGFDETIQTRWLQATH